MLRTILLPLAGAAAAVAIFAGAAVAGSGVGGTFNLGQTNTANATSTLSGTTSGAELALKNTSSDPGATALSLNVGAGRPPFKVSTSVKVGSLNSDLLDGYDSSAIPFYWKLGGNATTSTGVLGTTTNQALELKTSGTRALRLEPSSLAPNLIGGWAGNGNNANSGATGITIAGGGSPMSENYVNDDFGAIGGGFSNVAGDSDANPGTAESATVGGGEGNAAKAFSATIGGGDNNIAEGQRSTVGGGTQNHATGLQSFVGGGGANQATALNATVPGGDSNTASGKWSFAAGRRAKATDEGSFVWGDSTFADVNSSGANSFTVRASGGTHLQSGALSTAVASLAQNSTTPSVAGGNVFTANNTNSTTITNFTSGAAGQTITIVFADGTTQVQDGSNIHLQGNADYVPVSSSDTLMLVSTNGTDWFEVSRSSNF